jgi:hypothetical protein
MHQHSKFNKLLTKLEFRGSSVVWSIKPLRNHGISVAALPYFSPLNNTSPAWRWQNYIQVSHLLVSV